MDDPRNKGELFGYKNLFSYDEEKARLYPYPYPYPYHYP